MPSTRATSNLLSGTVHYRALYTSHGLGGGLLPYARVNGARIHYRRFGERGDAVPVFLIHGATVDGTTDWGAIAPVLGLSHDVIVPDCRGHGQSDNPGGGYRFRQLADDVAALIRALGFERAHVVGHSNGGNIALVTAIEHPEVVASCVTQAANAYVSDDLREREPANFEPDRVARDWPAWRDQMIRLHARWHGEDYWRELLALTVAEIISQPNYGSEDLGHVSIPALVIEGRKDQVNARSGHGAFIARGIPDAELWRPADVGHSVHRERPAEWLTHVEDFWRRRGGDAADRLWRLGRTTEFDPRTAVLEYAAGTGKRPVEVTVATHAGARCVRKVLAPSAIDMKLCVLEDEAEAAEVGLGVIDVLESPEPSSDRLTQALFGEQVLVLERRDRFARVRLEHDAHVGWVRAAALTGLRASGAITHRVWADQAIARREPGGAVAAHLPFGASLTALADQAEWLGIRAEEGMLWVSGGDLRAVDDALSMPAALARFRALVGVPYLWGGRTAWGFDCSGLTQALYAALGVRLPRDTDQQLAAGGPTEGKVQPGDLLFFGDPRSDDSHRVRHVAIQLDEPDEFLHAWGASASVTVSSRRHERAAALCGAFLGARRYGLPRGARV